MRGGRTGVALAAVLAWLGAGPGASPAKAPRAVTLPAVFDHNRMIVDLELVRPDGRIRRARAWVDTGNPFFMVAAPLARDLGLEPGAPAPALRFGGLPLDVDGITTKVGEGLRVMPGVPAEVNLPASALRRHHVVLDGPGRRLTVAQPGALKPRGEPLPCRVNPQTGLLQVAVAIDGETLQLGVDNGSAGTWVSDALTRAWAARHPDWPRATGAVGTANFFGFGFEPQGTLMRLPALRLGASSARGVGVLGLDQGLFDWYSKKTAGPVAGFLGANVLTGFRIEIDFLNGMTYWEPGRKPDQHDFDLVPLTLRPEADGGYTVVGVAARDGQPTVAGVQPGDKLLRVDGLDTSGATMGAVTGALRGKPGVSRTLVVERDGVRLTTRVKVVRLP